LFVIALILSCHTLHAQGCVCVCVFVCSPGACVFIFALMFPLHVLCVSLSSSNKLPNLLQALRHCPFGVCFSLLSFCLKPALSYHARSLAQHSSFSPSLFLVSLSPCEVCDLCNFILPVAGDISQSRSMNIDELIQSAVSKGQIQRSLNPTAPPVLPVRYTDMPTSCVPPTPPFSVSVSLSPSQVKD